MPRNPRSARRLSHLGLGAAIVVTALLVTATPALAVLSISQPAVPVLAPGATGEVTFSLASTGADEVGRITFTAPASTTFTCASYTWNGGTGTIGCAISAGAKTLTCPPTGLDTRSLYWSGTATIGVQLTMDPAAPPGTVMAPGVVTNFDHGGVQNAQGLYTAKTPPPADLAVTLDAASSGLSSKIPYTLTISNNGPAVAASAVITTQLPHATRTVDLGTSGCTYSHPAQQVSCPAGPLAAGASVVKSFSANFPLLTIGLALTATAQRTTSTPADPNPANDTAAVQCLAITPVLIVC